MAWSIYPSMISAMAIDFASVHLTLLLQARSFFLVAITVSIGPRLIHSATCIWIDFPREWSTVRGILLAREMSSLRMMSGSAMDALC